MHTPKKSTAKITCPPWWMAAIKSRNTKPEMLVRRFLHAKGFRYKLHDKSLPGKPDMFHQNTKQYYLYMAVSGMDIKAAMKHRVANLQKQATLQSLQKESWKI